MSSLFVNDSVIHDKVELIIFDKDGTLIDIHHYWGFMIKIRAEKITRRWCNSADCEKYETDLISLMGLDLATGKLKPEGPVGVKSRDYIVSLIKDYVNQHAKSISNNDVKLLFKDVDKITDKNLLPLLKILPGVKRLLERAKQLGVSAVITSNDITNRATKAIEVLGLKSYFKEIIGGDTVKNAKPSPDLAKLALSKIGCKPENAVVIGDHSVDILMGIGAGIGVNIGVLNGISRKENFYRCDCTMIENLLCVDIRK